MKPRCAQCGDTKPLNAQGVCAWRHGCEHRQFQHEAAMARLEAEMKRRDWHLKVQERYGSAPWDSGWAFPVSREVAEDYHPAASLLDFWKSHHPSQTNLWIDHWLLNPDDADEDDE